jgi:peptide/nickel transport system permease protein
LLAIPDLLLAIVFLVLAVETGYFLAGGMVSPGAPNRVLDVAWHLALPIAVLVLGMLPALVRHVRASMAEAIDSPFALSARAQGIPRRRLLFRHLLPAAANPLISLAGFSLGTLLSASLLIEVVMGWPGLGPLFLEAIMARDFAVVLAVVMLSASFLVVGNLLADVLLYRVDSPTPSSPRPAEHDEWHHGSHNRSGDQRRVARSQERDQEPGQRADARSHHGDHDPL